MPCDVTHTGTCPVPVNRFWLQLHLPHTFLQLLPNFPSPFGIFRRVMAATGRQTHTPTHTIYYINLHMHSFTAFCNFNVTSDHEHCTVSGMSRCLAEKYRRFRDANDGGIKIDYHRRTFRPTYRSRHHRTQYSHTYLFIYIFIYLHLQQLTLYTAPNGRTINDSRDESKCKLFWCDLRDNPGTHDRPCFIYPFFFGFSLPSSPHWFPFYNSQ